jgi:hypothetical protein
MSTPGWPTNVAMGDDQAISLWWIVGPIMIVTGLAISFALRRHRTPPELYGIWHYLGIADPAVGAALSRDRAPGLTQDRPILRGQGLGQHDEAGTFRCRGRRRFDAPFGKSRGCHHTRPHPDI